MKYLIAGLGNPGLKYENTRHNIGYQVLDFLAKDGDSSFIDKRYAYYNIIKYKARILVLIKPTTYMNLSGRAINYYLNKEKIPLENFLVVVDDVALPIGKIRIKEKGGSGGHNGLAHIEDIIGNNNYARLKFGIGNEFAQGTQSNYVLGQWEEEESKIIKNKIPITCDAIKSFTTLGIERTMNFFNNK